MKEPTHTLLREAERPQIARGGGARTTQMVTPDCGASGLLNGFTTIGGGGAIPMHFHNCEESVLILSGTAIVEAGAERFRAAAGDVTWLPADLPHRFINASEAEPLRIFWTYASVEATRTLVDTGETTAILAERPGDG